jgi:hypothetical protein
VEEHCKDKLPDLQEHLDRVFQNTSSFVSRKPLVESTSSETSSSQKIVIESEILKGDENSISSNVIDPISEHITISDLGKEVVESIQEEDSSSSLNSSQTEPKKDFSIPILVFPFLKIFYKSFSLRVRKTWPCFLASFIELLISHLVQILKKPHSRVVILPVLPLHSSVK